MKRGYKSILSLSLVVCMAMSIITEQGYAFQGDGLKAPIISISTSEWTNKSVNVDLRVAEEGNSKHDNIKYMINNSNIWMDYKKTLTILQEGVTEIKAKTIGENGSEAISEIAQVKIDTLVPQPPKFTVEKSKINNSDVKRYKLTLSKAEDSICPQDKSFSGIKNVLIRIDDGKWFDYSNSIEVSLNSILYAQSVDNAGNKSGLYIFNSKKVAKNQEIQRLSIQEKGKKNDSINLNMNLEEIKQISIGNKGIDVFSGNFGTSVPISMFSVFNANLQYNSLSFENTQNGVFGAGWTSSFEGFISGNKSNKDSEKIVSIGGGYYKIFIFDNISSEVNDQNTYEALIGSDVLKQKADKTFELITEGKMIYKFNEEGFLTEIKDSAGNSTYITVEKTGTEKCRILKVKKVTGEALYFEYKNDSNSELVSSIIDETTQKPTKFTYNDLGCLIGIDYGISKATYEYSSKYPYSLTKIINKDGTVVSSFMYAKKNGEATASLDVFGAVTEYLREFNVTNSTYTVTEKVVDNKDVSSEQSSTAVKAKYVFDITGNLLEKDTFSQGKALKMINEYDKGTIEEICFKDKKQEINREPRVISSYNEANGTGTSKTTYTYDCRGNMIEIKRPNKEPSIFSFDENDNIVLSIDGSNSARIYEYNDYGKVTKEIIPLKPGVIIYEKGVNPEDYAITDLEFCEPFSKENPSPLKGLVKSITTYSGGNSEKIVNEKKYDKYGRCIATKNSIINKWATTEYNNANQVIKTVDEKGIININEYDDWGQLVRQTEDAGGKNLVTRIINDTENYITQKISDSQYDPDKDGLNDPEKTQSYSDSDVGFKLELDKETGNISKTTLSNSTYSKIYKYDYKGRVLKKRDFDGKYRSYVYDDSTNTTITIVSDDKDKTGSIEESTQNLITSNCDSGSKIIVSKDKFGTQTTERDEISGTSKQTSPDGKISLTYYNQDGSISKKIYPYIEGANNDDHTSIFFYDYAGRLIETRTPFERLNGVLYYSIDKTEYNELGQVIAKKVSCNALGEELKFKTTKYRYDSIGNRILVAMCDENGVETNFVQYFYDKEGNILRMYTGLSSPITFSGLDEVVASEDKDYAVTKYEYNKYNQLTKVTDPMGKSEIFAEYDKAGNLLKKYDKNETCFEYEFDMVSNAKLLEKAFKKSNKTNTPDFLKEYHYETVNNTPNTLVGISQTYYDRSGDESTKHVITIAMDRDKEGNISRQKDENGNIKSYRYDELGNLLEATVKNPKGELISKTVNEYDKQNRLVKVFEDASISPVVVYTYDNLGRKVSMTYANGVKTEYEYNCGNFVTKITSTNIKGDVISKFKYVYLTSGQEISEVADNGISAIFQYDAFGRLIAERRIGVVEATITYTYDDYHNRATMTEDNSITLKYNYDKNNELLNVVDKEGKVISEMKYDDNGNLLKTIESEEGKSKETNFKYDSYNRQIEVEKVIDEKDINNEKALYSYGIDGLMLSKTDAKGVATNLVWDNKQQIIAETDENGEPESKYLRGLTLVACKNINKEGNAEKTYYLFNAHGDVVAVTNDFGELIKIYSYSAFGNELESAEDNMKIDSNPFRYSGEYFDSFMGDYYLRARYYSPIEGRFNTEDTFAGFEDQNMSQNRYIYCTQDPVNNVDPSGHWGKDVHSEYTYQWLMQNSTLQNHTDLVFAIIAGDEYTDYEISYFHEPGTWNTRGYHGDFQGAHTGDYINPHATGYSIYDLLWGKVWDYSSYAYMYINSASDTDRHGIMHDANTCSCMDYTNFESDPYTFKMYASLDSQGIFSTSYTTKSINLFEYYSTYYYDYLKYSGFLAGIGLHSLQDDYAHMSTTHQPWYDDIHCDYGGANDTFVYPEDSNRYDDVKKATKDYGIIEVEDLLNI